MGSLLFLAHRVPFPPDRGDKIRGWHMLRHLARSHRVHLCAFADDPRDLQLRVELVEATASRTILWRSKGQALAAAEGLASGRPVSLTAFDSPAMRRAVTDVLAREPIDALYVFSGQMAQYLPADVNASVVMDFVDMDSAKFAQYAAEAKGPMRWLMAREARLLQAFEAQVATRVDASLFVSEAEAALFRQATGASRVQAIGNGLDTSFYDPAACPAVDEAGPLIVFTGQMDYRPNIDAVGWFARSVLPQVRARHPQARFAIVGRAPVPAVRALEQEPGVVVTGEVADVRGWLAAASVVVAPLRIARGVQNKVLEAMAMARPVVASPEAAEGIDHGGCLRVAADAGAFAAEVATLLDDPEAGRTLGSAARAQVQRRYAWDAQLAPLSNLLAGKTA
ncbi:TIGR03087 family PEP-CTERM/XrtA system glycosyltransferase [Sphingomonas sp. PL-96]|uniref:TIGR03087 family PEP-CTERM/XrtA system glycosyltransferase n=1 Tax=Sphingomonas sp. PL-96 TaxID=2887201 RepID=UPI001E41FABE|nr:TIGR03087 family PEP-CTERM/XrtA system glycosyltransferase [Sphingomonas sp. PL-96]MCC2975608.1 TIGR03087 family PEP-CTERM/XrtA system glycosyltransferase [Sphingomonas sp. PL-96]